VSRLRAVPADYDPLAVSRDNRDLILRNESAPLDEATEERYFVDETDPYAEVDERLMAESRRARMTELCVGELDQRIIERLFAKEPDEAWELIADELGISLRTLDRHRKQLASPDGVLFVLLED